MSSKKYTKWSEWEWSDDRQEFYRCRTNLRTGKKDWEYDTGTQTASGADHNPGTPYDAATQDNAVIPRSIGGVPGNIETRMIRGQTSSTQNTKDSKFKLHPSRDFVFGRIFKVLWSEPKGTGGTEITGPQNEYTKIRRFVVMDDTRSGHSLCLPILTYAGFGTTKRGCHVKDHAVIHSDEQPVLLPRETGMIHPPILCKMNHPRQKLDYASRLNLAKVYTVEHNVEVQFIGRVADSHKHILVQSYDSIHPLLGTRLGVAAYSTPHTYGTYSTSQQNTSPGWNSAAGVTNTSPLTAQETNPSRHLQEQTPYSAAVGPPNYDHQNPNSDYYLQDQALPSSELESSSYNNQNNPSKWHAQDQNLSGSTTNQPQSTPQDIASHYHRHAQSPSPEPTDAFYYDYDYEERS